MENEKNVNFTVINNIKKTDFFNIVINNETGTYSKFDLHLLMYISSFIESINNDKESSKYFSIKPYNVSSSSMSPTLLVGDKIMVNLKYYNNANPKRGDIVTYKMPKDPTKIYLHKIIAIVGDELFIKDKKVYLNNELINESYVTNNDKSILNESDAPRDNLKKIVIPKNSFFIMGDNRDNSFDSRFFGVVKFDAIDGKVFFIYLSDNPERIGINFN